MTEIKQIDCDVHPAYPEHWSVTLAPYLNASWSERASTLRRFRLPVPVFSGKSGGPERQDLVARDGIACSRADVAAVDLFEEQGADRALLLPEGVLGLGAVHHAGLATAIAAATNDWISEEWLAVDRRFRGNITVSVHDPEAAAKEIYRWRDHDRMVGVLVPLGRTGLAHPSFRPILQAAADTGRPLVLHPSATEGLHTESVAITGGSTAYGLELRVSWRHPYQSAIAALVASGAFERFPTLKVLCSEVGVAWLPDFLWTLDDQWRTNPEDTPNLTRAPSEYVRERIKFTTQPFVEPTHRKHLPEILEMIDASRLLAFSSDYPHWDYDDPKKVFAGLDPLVAARIGAGNAIDLFGDMMVAD